MVGGETTVASTRARRLRKAMTPHEVKLWVHLRALREAHGVHFRRQVPRLGYILDFACLRAGLVVEVDGGQHGGMRDQIRDRRLRDAGLRVLRVWNNEVDENLDGVMEAIVAAVVSPPTALRAVPPPRSGEG
jgi:very-short-patch-repair endonuclease